MAYKTFDGKKVHPYWFRFLYIARKHGVKFHVNSGKRTLAEQWRLYRNYRRTGWPVAAFPSPIAPHIRPRHAIDVNDSQHLIDFGHRHGVKLTRAVRGEVWHLEANWAQLKKFYKRHSK